jgi:hypothetical protein
MTTATTSLAAATYHRLSGTSAGQAGTRTCATVGWVRSTQRRGIAPVADGVLRVTGSRPSTQGRSSRRDVGWRAAVGPRPRVSESVDVLQCTRTADRSVPRLRSQRSRRYWARRRHPIFTVDRGVPAPGSIAGPVTCRCRPAGPGRCRTGRPPPSHLHERFTGQARSQLIADGSLANATETLAILPPATSTRECRPRRSEPAVAGVGERSGVCAALVDSRDLPCRRPSQGFPPSFRHRRREMGSRRRQPVRCRPQSTWWEGRRPVRDAEVAGYIRAHTTRAGGLSDSASEDLPPYLTP